jgi:tetratricopeptide (TPR) repeat protein
MINRLAMIFLLMSTSCAHAMSNQEIFLRGNKEYQSGAYQDALEWYEQIAHKGDAVWHNMGNCCYHLNRFVDARVYWERARKHASYDDYCTLQTQLAALDAQLEDEELVQPAAWILWIRSHTASYSLIMIQIITLIFWFVFCIAAIKRMHWLPLLILLAISVFGIWLSMDMQRQRSGNYAVTAEEIPLYVGPNSSYDQQGVIKQAHTVSITDKRDGWYKIAYKGLAGWVQADKLVSV